MARLATPPLQFAWRTIWTGPYGSFPPRLADSLLNPLKLTYCRCDFAEETTSIPSLTALAPRQTWPTRKVSREGPSRGGRPPPPSLAASDEHWNPGPSSRCTARSSAIFFFIRYKILLPPIQRSKVSKLFNFSFQKIFFNCQRFFILFFIFFNRYTSFCLISHALHSINNQLLPQ